jgi:type III pantothenate kinase
MSDPQTVLCLDIGNSHTVIGVYIGDQIADSWRLNTIDTSTSDELFLRLKMLLDSGGFLDTGIQCIGLSSVVPAMERPWNKAIHKLLGKNAVVVSSQTCSRLPIRYDHPKSLGADRICNVIALLEQGYQSAIALDLGTATTFDILWEGQFYGGLILPGLQASMQVLTDKAKRLPPVSLEWPAKVIAQNTEDALKSGLLYGYVGSIEGILAGIRQELDVEFIPVIATGGWSAILSERCPSIMEFDPHLTLKGIRKIALETQNG